MAYVRPEDVLSPRSHIGGARAAAEQSPSSLVSRYREMAQDAHREDEAEEWLDA